MEEKSGDIVHKSCKFNQQLILLWVEENKAVFVAILFLMLCFGIMDTVVFFINNTFLHVTTVGRNVWLDWLFDLPGDRFLACGYLACILKRTSGKSVTDLSVLEQLR